jgi:hypothetical protein
MRPEGELRMTKGYGLLLALMALATWGAGTRAQTPEPPKPAAGSEQAAATAPLPVIKTESRIVLVDAVVRDKRGNYIQNLQQQEFKVYEDNKEQAITSFSFGSDPGSQEKGQKRYMVLFFDNSSMDKADQIQARKAAGTFIEKYAGPERLMAIAEFGGSLMIKQNFTANAAQLKAAVSGIQTPYLETNPDFAEQCCFRPGRAIDASGDSESGKEFARRARPKDAGVVLGGIPTGRGTPVGIDGDNRCL